MRKVIGAINMTLDGFCDHTAISPDEEIHDHYTKLMREGGEILYGRITYELMEFWKTILENPSDEKSMNDFELLQGNRSPSARSSISSQVIHNEIAS